MDREGTIIAIKTGKLMRGSNAWMLICSIMIASLGLDLNSEAVIIGAMLISPLMSPILGVGLGVSINDRETLFMALKHFFISILIALITSTVYFWLTPLGTFTDMIEARTAPTFLDGLVAIFGGLAGIISITRKDKSNAIPGVAIATALMPPLCVTGYGIANGNLEIALNSFYLFFLNSFFIALTSYLIIRLLQFPYKEHPNPRDALRARIAVTIFSLLLIVPGTSILRDVIQDLRQKQNIKTFVKEQFATDCIDYNLFEITPDSNILVLQLINRDVPDSMTQAFNQMLAEKYELPNTYFQVIPDYRIKLGDLEKNAVGSNQLNQGSFGAEFVPELKQEGITKVFEKGTDPAIDSYSGFFDNGHRKATGLGDWLKEQGITRVYVLGLATDYCVKFTALDALQLGFETYLVEDASRGVNLAPGDVDQAVADMRAAGVQVVQSDSLLQAQ
eukprot:g45.t1